MPGAVMPAAAGSTITAVTIGVTQRGANVGMSAKKLSGESYLAFAAKTT